MKTNCEKAKHLKEKKIGAVASAMALGTSINNVKLWRKDRTKPNHKGRPSYLNKNEEELLVAAVLSADQHHDSVDAKQLRQKVAFPISPTFFCFFP